MTIDHAPPTDTASPDPPAVGVPDPPPRPGSRMARFAHPLALHAVKQMAAEHGVCIRPVLMRRTELDTGRTDVIDLPCGSTRESRSGSALPKLTIVRAWSGLGSRRSSRR